MATPTRFCVALQTRKSASAGVADTSPAPANIAHASAAVRQDFRAFERAVLITMVAGFFIYLAPFRRCPRLCQRTGNEEMNRFNCCVVAGLALAAVLARLIGVLAALHRLTLRGK